MKRERKPKKVSRQGGQGGPRRSYESRLGKVQGIWEQGRPTKRDLRGHQEGRPEGLQQHQSPWALKSPCGTYLEPYKGLGERSTLRVLGRIVL